MGAEPMPPEQLAGLVTNLGAAADLVEAINAPAIQL